MPAPSPGPFTIRFPGWTDVAGWASPAAYSSIVCADVDGDGQAEIMGILNGWIQTYHFDTALGQWNRLQDFSIGPGNVILQAFDLDCDGQCELVLESSGAFGFNTLPTLHFNNQTMTWSRDPWPLTPNAAVQVCCGVLGSVGNLFARMSAGVYTVPFPTTNLSSLMAFDKPPNGPLLSDAAGWGTAPYSSTMRCGDVNGDGNAEIVIRGPDGIHVFTYDPGSESWTPAPADPSNGPSLTDESGWSNPAYYSTIQLADVNGDGRQEIVASGPRGLYVFFESDGAWTPADPTAPNGPTLDPVTWQNPLYYPSLTCADVDGDGQDEIVARGPGGVLIFHYDLATSNWSPNSDQGPANGPPLSDANGWGLPQYALTVRAADVNGDGKAEIMGRQPDGVYTYRLSPDGTSWIGASAPFPDLQTGAYEAISMALGIHNGQLRTMYTDSDDSVLTGYLIDLKQSDFLASNNLDTGWQPSVDQLATELSYGLDVQGIFEPYSELILGTTFADKLSLDTVAASMQLSQQVQQGSQSITASIFELIAGAIWSLSALTADAPMLAVVSGLLDSSLSFATSKPGGETIPTNPVSQTYIQLNAELKNTFDSLRTSNSANEETVLTDYGLLMTVGGLIDSGQWTWPVDSNPDPQTVIEAQYELWAWQTLSAVAWTVNDSVYMNGHLVSDRAPPSQYDESWFWWGPVTVDPTQPSDQIQHCRWLILASLGDYQAIITSVLHELFDPPPDGLGASASDVLTGANGWSIPMAPP
jgi:hypothetical protein